MIKSKLSDSSKISIRKLSASDIPTIVNAFQKINWSKPVSLFAQYLSEQEIGERLIWLAFVENHFAGYVTLKWQSLYQSFRNQNIPEIIDLNVLPNYRKFGVGSYLLQTAEQTAAERRDTIGIGVGLYAGEDGGYGAAQRLYIKRGYIPDGNGVTYNYQPAIPYNNYSLDDDLVLWLIKKL